jgi:hypothetical protein
MKALKKLLYTHSNYKHPLPKHARLQANMSRALILALCLCLAGSAAVRAAAGDDSDPFCPGADQGMPGGWTMLNDDMNDEVSDFLSGKVSQASASAPSSSGRGVPAL